MASTLGVSPNYYAELESGERKPGKSLALLIEMVDEAQASVERARERGFIVDKDGFAPSVTVKDDTSDDPMAVAILGGVRYVCRFGTDGERAILKNVVQGVYDAVLKRLERMREAARYEHSERQDDETRQDE